LNRQNSVSRLSASFSIQWFRFPYIPMLKENNVRKGFFEHENFLSLHDALPSYLQGFVTFAYMTGWRISEIIGLKWSQVDLNQGSVRLEAGTTKNDDARTVFLDEELKAVFAGQAEARKKAGKLVAYVFPGKDGFSRIRDIRGAWEAACNKAKIGRRLFHDLRGTAVRNMVRAGVPERVAMTISGHKTRSVFDRYNIVSEADLKLASQKQEEYLGNVTGTISGTIGEKGEKEQGTKKAQVIEMTGAGGRNRTDMVLSTTGF
jgi:integrase